MNSKDRFNETHLPPKEAFYSTLSGQHISDDDYMHAIRVWKVFNIKNMGEYNDLYLLTDVLLLADVFESFRNMCLKYYSLDPCHYITLPSFAWDASLRIHNQVLELFTGEQSDMYLKVEDSIRGGISMITHKYAKANNKYMSSYDKNKSPLYIIYLDANNLYGWAMSQYLPYGNYQDDTDVDKYTPEYIMSLEDNTHEGCFLVVDLEYPKELHDLHNDYPLAPQRKRVTKDMLSNHTKEIMNKSYLFLNPSKKDSEKNKDRSKGDAVDKLICDFSDKINYGIHYRALKFYLRQGLKLKKVHSVITFSQSAWLKEYIDFNTAKRAVAKNDFEKDFFKLMNNAVFGKTMENVRNRINMVLINNDLSRLKRYTAKPNFKRATIFDDPDTDKLTDCNVCAVHMTKNEVTLHKPIMIGQAILDLSKVHMFIFYYNALKKQYGDKIKLLFTDTDSLCFEVETEDYYNDIVK